MNQEWWLTAAVSDARVVAELLIRLKDSSAVGVGSSPTPPPMWGARQPRSSVEKKRHPRRRGSPTTPLSWSDDSSAEHAQPSDRFRSKISASSTESPSTSVSWKRHPRKKAFSELKDEESSLLKARTQLKTHLTLDDQRSSVNSNLKRRKLDFPVESGTNSVAKCTEPKEESTTQNVLRQVKCKEASQDPHSCLSQQKCEMLGEPSFVLPDLNMMPDEDCELDTTFFD